LTGHGPSSKVSTTSLSVRKSSCLKCSKPKPGATLGVDLDHRVLTPELHPDWRKRFSGSAGAGNRLESEAVTSTSPWRRACCGFRQRRSAGAVCEGGVQTSCLFSARGEEAPEPHSGDDGSPRQTGQHRPNALRIASPLSKYAKPQQNRGGKPRPAINAKTRC